MQYFLLLNLLVFASFTSFGQVSRPDSTAKRIFQVPASCPEAKTANEMGRCASYFYTNHQYQKALELYQQLEAMQHDALYLLRIYGASANLRLPFDTLQFTSSENPEELYTYARSLSVQDIGLAYRLCEKSEQLRHSSHTLTQLHNLAMVSRKPFDEQLFLKSEDAKELTGYGQYLEHAAGKESYPLALTLYKKAQRLAPSSDGLIRLHQIAEKLERPFDLQQFSRSKNSKELLDYCNYFESRSASKEKYPDKVPDLQFALSLLEKALALDTAKWLRSKAASSYSNLAFYQLFIPDGKAAEKSVRRAIALDANWSLSYTNLAPALLLQGNYKNAEKEYLKWKDKPLQVEEVIGEEVSALDSEEPPPPSVPNSYKSAFLSDLDELEKNGVTHPDFSRIRALLQQ